MVGACRRLLPCISIGSPDVPGRMAALIYWGAAALTEGRTHLVAAWSRPAAACSNLSPINLVVKHRPLAQISDLRDRAPGRSPLTAAAGIAANQAGRAIWA